MENKHVDFIIVGQGIAGTLLSYFLLKNNRSIVVVDEEKEGTSSKIAAGIYNPIVFKRLVKSWRADELIVFLESFYPELESFLNCKFFYKKKMVKLFASHEEKIFWQKKAKLQQGLTYLGDIQLDNYSENSISSNFAYAFVEHSGYVDLPTLLYTFKKKLVSINAFVREKINYEDIVVTNNKVKWKNYTANNIVFCEGYKGLSNPLTPFCKLKPVKGDILTIESTQLTNSEIINKGIFLLPTLKNQFKTGSTYNWDYKNEIPEEKSKNEILGKLNLITKVKYHVVKHEAGIRPASFDRRPILGKHSAQSNIAVFNGLGTKGVMLGPFFAKQLADNLIFDFKIDAEVSAERFSYNNLFCAKIYL